MSAASASSISTSTSVIPRSKAWKKLNEDVLAAQRAIQVYRLANPSLISEAKRNDFAILKKAYAIALKRLDEQEQKDIEELKRNHFEHMTEMLDESSVTSRYPEVFKKRLEKSIQTGVMSDISDSKQSFEIAWKIATDIYDMYPHFIKDKNEHILMLRYSPKFPSHFSIIWALDFGLYGSSAAQELNAYVNFLYYQIQEKKLAMFSDS